MKSARWATVAGGLPIVFALALLAVSACAQAKAFEGDDAEVALDLPAQPLAKALERFMSTTGVAVMADSALLAGRRSAPLDGRYTPAAALRAMLTGTGLNLVVIGNGAFTLQPPPDVVRPLPSNLRIATAIQAAVTAAMCQQSDTRVMQYRTVLRLWLDPAGAVTRVELASSTGDSSVDRAIVSALQHVQIGSPLPSGLPQPVKLAIFPESRDKACFGSKSSKVGVP